MISNLFANIKNNYILLLILALAAVLRLYNIDFQSIWLDEIHTMIESDPKLSYSEFYDIMYLREQMPHLYFLITRFFSLIIDHSVVVVRSISAIIGLLCVYSIYFLGKELDSKKAGLIAALLMAVNYFHVFYSQEARPYILLCLFTILSFLFLLRFTKKLTFKSGIYFALFASLMISTHFFGLFVLVSQIIILFIYLLTIEKKLKRKLIINSVIAGLTIILIYIPSIPILLKISKMGSFWIPPPTNVFFKQTFNEFFGNSEFLIYSAILLIIAFFVKVFSEKDKNDTNKSNNRFSTSFIFLIVWLFVIFMIPYIRSYTNVPMLISRYFMSALPAVILILSIGLANIKSKVIVVLISCIFVISSFVDLFIVRHYYETVNKTQYREITAEVKMKNTDNSPIISPWAWHLEFFFDKNENTLTQNTLNEYLDMLRLGKAELSNFWFLDAHFHPFEITTENQMFLDQNFDLMDTVEYYDTWAKYYWLKNNNHIITLPLNEFTPNYLVNNEHLLIISNSTVSSKRIEFEKGKYRLIIQTKSTPNPPINNVNSHVDVSLGGKRLGGFYTSSNKVETTFFEFLIKENSVKAIELTFDNDYFDYMVDRDLLIYAVFLEKLKK